MTTLLICNAQLVNEGVIFESDVYIRDGRIEQISPNLSHLSSDRFIDAKGLYLLPGMIDTQFSLASSTFSEERFLSETSAAVAGGITSVMLLPTINSEQKTGLPKAKQLEQLRPNLKNNLAIYEVANPINLGVYVDSSIKGHICAVFASMIGVSDYYRFDSLQLVEELVGLSSVVVAIEADDMPSVLENEESYRQIYGDDIPIPFHSVIRGAKSCADTTEAVLGISEKLNKQIHILHVSCTEEIELIESAKRHDSLVTADVCSHFLTFSESDYEQKGALLKYNPAIKSDIDRASLMQGLLDNNITNICSGHTPYSLKEKQGSYFEVAAGMPQAQLALPAILEHFQDQIFSLELIVEKISHSVADTFLIKDRGYIREGYWADLVLVDIDESFIARNEDVLSTAGWTIYSGNEFRSSVVNTIVNGDVVWSKKDDVDVRGSGKLLEFNR
ncbi:dihydroorotase [Leucothrix arctica]|uniref:Dihydroorotase n=1 Tax=Leucothrix arctica TaxID=1481894 RepID=A0A317CK24_9GAMM|nr:dihydroorotase [Leucothrix arctica]PWQ98934.1 dihydroorotase [Leucothrix arctica]